MKKFLLFLGITAFVLISLFALDCNQADNQLPNNNQNQTDTNTGPITPGDIALVGANVTVTVFNGSCELMVEYIDCVEHSPCTIENCAGWEIKGSFTNPLLENDPVRVGYASGYVNNEYSAKFTVISDTYTIDYIRCADMYGDNWTQFETIPLMSSANNYAYMEIYLKAI